MNPIAKFCQSRVENARGTIAMLAAELAERPYHALSWAADSFYAAAVIRVLGRYIDVPESFTFEQLAADLEPEVLGASMHIPSSTSRLSNFLEDNERVVRAELLELARQQIRYQQQKAAA